MPTTSKTTAKKRIFKLYEVVGWYGMAAIVAAYGLNSFDIVGTNNYFYQGLNLTGAAGLMWISYKKGVAQTVVLNTFWALIALLAIGRLVLG